MGTSFRENVTKYFTIIQRNRDANKLFLTGTQPQTQCELHAERGKKRGDENLQLSIFV